MSNNVINGSYSAAYSYQSAALTATTKSDGKETSISAIYESLDISASVSLELGSKAGEIADKSTYSTDVDKVNALKSDFNRHLDAFKQMVTKLFETQGGVGNVAMDNIHAIINKITKAGGIDQLSQQQAQELISEDGYWGVEKTATRILDFAKALTGGDPSKIESMKNAFQKGFDQAEKLWGGKLPEISYQTHEKVMKGFEEWANPVAADEEE